MPDWLELELAERLAPARAPEELWNRILETPARRRRPVRSRVALGLWAAPAAIAAATLALTFSIPSPSLAQLAKAELVKSRAAGFDSSALDSTDPGAIEHWLRANASVDLSIPRGAPVQLTGARVVQRNGVRIGEVRYRASGREAVLLIGRGSSAQTPIPHGRAMWTAHGQVYALAYAGPQASQLACRICHLD